MNRVIQLLMGVVLIVVASVLGACSKPEADQSAANTAAPAEQTAAVAEPSQPDGMDSGAEAQAEQSEAPVDGSADVVPSDEGSAPEEGGENMPAE